MVNEYIIDGVFLECRDPICVTEDYVSLRVEPIGYCRNIEIISREVNRSIKQITWLDTQYKCSPIYHKMEPVEIGDCLNCNDPILVEMNDFLQEVFVKTSTLHVNIISRNYSIGDSQSLCNDILGSLSSIKDIISDDSEIMTEAFYIQRTSLESLFDNVLTMIGVPNPGIMGQFTKLYHYINNMNGELSLLDNLLSYDE